MAVRCLFLALLLCCLSIIVPAFRVQYMAHQYIVVLKESGGQYRDHSLAALCDSLVGVTLLREFRIHNRRFGVIQAGLNVPASLQSHPLVANVEANQRVQYNRPQGFRSLMRGGTTDGKTSTSGACQSDVMGPNGWAPTRSSYRNLPNYSRDPYKSGNQDNGTDVRVYVLDTGIDVEHVDFGGRAVWGMTGNAVSNETDTDNNGHGTNVAGIAGGARFGLAQNATLVSCKVIGADGYAVTSDIIEAVAWVTQDVRDRSARGRKTRAVINMSFGGAGRSVGLEIAVQDAISLGIPVVIAAGNENADACNFSPSSVPPAVTVGATASNDSLAYFSNYGRCVDIQAPGVNVAGPWIDTPGSHAAGVPPHSYYTLVSGTSQATPVVSGIIARLLSSMSDAEFQSATPASIATYLTTTATSGKVIISNPAAVAGTPNLLAYKDCGTYQPATPTASSQTSSKTSSDNVNKIRESDEDDDDDISGSSVAMCSPMLNTVSLAFLAFCLSMTDHSYTFS